MSLTELITKALAKVTRQEVLARCHAVKVPAGPIHTVAEALGADQAKARETVIEMAAQDTAKGKVALLGNPLKLSRTPVQYRHAPPCFGQDTQKVLKTFDIKSETD